MFDDRFLAGVKAAADAIQYIRVARMGDRSEDWWKGSDEAESVLRAVFPDAFPGHTSVSKTTGGDD